MPYAHEYLIFLRKAIAAAGVISAFGSRIRLGGHNPISQPRTCNQCGYVRIRAYPDPGLKSAMTG
jgi:hypothetical protein